MNVFLILLSAWDRTRSRECGSHTSGLIRGRVAYRYRTWPRYLRAKENRRLWQHAYDSSSSWRRTILLQPHIYLHFPSSNRL